MINAGDKVKLVAEVASTGAGVMNLAIKEFYIDGAWYKLSEAKELEISTDDYSNELTDMELMHIKQQADKDSQSIALDARVLEICKSISKKLSGGTID